MSERPDRARHAELPSPDDRIAGGDGFVYRRRLVPPVVSVALLVAIVVGFTGVGLGYKLGQSSRPAASPASSALAVSGATATAGSDIQADSVSDRLRLASQAVSPGSWAICDLAATIVCRVLAPSLSVSPAVHHTYGFTYGDMAELGQPAIEPGHVVLAAGLGKGVVTGSLIAISAPYDQVRTHALTPIDPGRAGVDYFDLGRLDGGIYGILLGFIPQTDAQTSAPLLDSYLASFAVTG
jgi:hypothetical protein